MKGEDITSDDRQALGWLLAAGVGLGLAIKLRRPSFLNAMVALIRSQATIPDIRAQAAELTAHCGGDELCRLRAIYRFVANDISYMPDPWDEDYLASALETLKVGAGDCDCKSILLATLLRANGFACALDLVPGHVLVEAYVSSASAQYLPAYAFRRPEDDGGAWVFLESTATGEDVGWIDAQTYQELGGLGASRLEF